MRAWTGVLGVLMLVTGLSTLGGAPAGAQAATETTPLTCQYTVSAVAIPGGAHITVDGVAPPGRTVRAFFDPAATAAPDPAPIGPPAIADADGRFHIEFDINQTGEITVGVDGYPPVLCESSAGTGVGSGGANQGRIVIGALPRTGASHTSTFVWAGLAALAAGAALVVGSRRMRDLRGRATG